MADATPYVVRIYAGQHVQFLGVASDEDDESDLPRTADQHMAATYAKFSDARRAAKDAASRHPDHQFKVFPLGVDHG